MVKDSGGYLGKGGYLGQARTSRRNRSNNLIKKWMDNLPKDKKINKPKGKRNLIMLIIGIILFLIALIKANS